MAIASSIDLYSTVKNLMGVDHYFGYLGPHGRKLKANSAYTVPGNLIESTLRSKMGAGRQKFKALERDLLNGRIAITATPKPIFTDPSPPAVVANPTVATTAANAGNTVWTGTTGSYYIVYTWLTGYGETTIGTSRIASPITVTNGVTQLQITVPSLPTGATGVNIYMSTTSGAEVFLMTSATGGAKNAPANFPTQAALPSSSTATLPVPARAPAILVSGGGSTGGLLAAGAYFAKITYTNANGETTGSPESVNFTVSAGNIPALFIEQPPSGVTGVNIYLTAASGATNTEDLYASVPVPLGATAFPSIITPYLQAGTATNLETANAFYLLAVAAPTSSTTVPVSNTAVVSDPTFTPQVVVTTNGIPASSAVPTVITPYLAPGLLGDVTYTALQNGGALQPGTYFLKFTYNTAAGETKPSPESAQFTVTAGQIPIVMLVPPTRDPEGSFMFPAGVTSCNIYLTAANGATATETLYLSTVTAPFTRLLIQQGNVAWPTSNTTAGYGYRTLQISGDALSTTVPSWLEYHFTLP